MPLTKFSLILIHLFVLLLCCHQSFAKKEYEFSFDTTRRLYNGGSYRTVKVIDMRPQKDNFGTIKKGLAKKSLTTGDSFNHELEIYGDALVQGVPYTANNNLLILLHQLEVQHHMSGVVSTMYLYAEYYISDETGKYQYLFSVDEFYESPDMEPKEEINNIFYDYFHTAAMTRLSIPGSVPEYTIAEAMNRIPNLKSKYKVYSTAEYKQGVYYTFEQFLDNTPGDTAFIESDHFLPIGNSPTFYHATARGGKGSVIKEDEFFAVYNGERWFKSTPHGNFGMRKDGDDFVFKSELKGIDGYHTFSVASSIIAVGVVGTMVTSAANKAAVRKYDTAPSTDKQSSKEKIFYELKVDCFKNQFFVVRRLQ